MQATYRPPRSPHTITTVAGALLMAALLGGMGGYVVKAVQSAPGAHIDSVVLDPFTGYPSGSYDDQRILALLKQSGYEGGGTVVPGGSAESNGQ